MAEKLRYIPDISQEEMVPIIELPDERQLALKIAGPKEGTPIIGFHGNPGSRLGPWPRSHWLHMAGIRLISFDRPGYGMSTRNPGRAIRDTAADVEAIADCLGIEQFAVHARSGGVPHALGCAALLKDRVVNAGVMVGVAPRNNLPQWDEEMTDFNKKAHAHAASLDIKRLSTDLGQHAIAALQDKYSLLNSLEPDLHESDKAIVQDLRSLIADSHTEGLSQEAAGWIDDTIAINKDWGFRLSGITARTLVWHGEYDAFVPLDHAEWLHEQIPNSQLIVAPNASHFGSLRHLCELLAWQRMHFDR